MDRHPAPFSASVAHLDANAVIVLIGELDLDAVPELRKAFADPDIADRPEVVVDCSGLSFIDSSGLSVLLAEHKRLAQKGSRLVIRSPQPGPLRVLEITGLFEYFDVEPVEPSD
jgi:anti-anti-sigma factor